MRATRVALLAVLAMLVTLALAAPAGAVVVGIADQKPGMFTDPRFLSLGITHARYGVGWDVLTSEDQTRRLERWLEAARLANVAPLITFGHSLTPGKRRSLPSPERFKYEFRRFRQRYPWVWEFATWNEANHCGEPTCHRAALVASYYRKLRQECPGCRILAADVLDMPNMIFWVKAFQRALRFDLAYWGLHNYVDTNRMQTTQTRALLAATKGQIWFTETGGIVARRNRSTVTFEESPAHAALALRWLFGKLVPISPRIARVYVYQWNSSSDADTWDSALIGPDGVARPGYAEVERAVVRARKAQQRPAK